MATGIVSQLLAGGVQGVGTGIAKVIDSIKGKSPEDAAKLAEIAGRHADLIAQLDADQKKADTQANVKLNETAGENIRAEQSDKYTGRARPTVIYAWILVILYNYIITGLIGKAPIQMPDMFWEVSGIVITGYVFARTGDKLFGGAGGSVKGLGLNIESKGD